MRKAGVNLTKLATLLPWTSKTIYRHIQDPDLPYDKLLEYSKALHYDFKEEFPEMESLRKQLAEPYNSYKTGDKETEAEYYRNKYEQLLEKYNDMLERYNALLMNNMPA